MPKQRTYTRDELEALIHAANHVIDSWSTGNLAEAVNALSGELEALGFLIED